MIGFVNVFKPVGPTSAQTVARVRRIYSTYSRDRKIAVGHLGTLDPNAAGVLPVAIGKATRLIPLLNEQRKSYVCTLVAGRSTTTADAQGDTLREASLPHDWRDRLETAAERFIGQIEQLPPMYSAAHYRGRRLYQLARAGQEVERTPRTVTIYGIRILGYEQSAARLRIACSEGTYVRTLCEALGEAVGVPAHMGALVREGSGTFVLSESRMVDDIAEDPHGALIAPEHIIPFPTVVLDLRASADFRAGRIVPLPIGSAAKHVFVRDESRTLVGVGETHGALLAPRKVFA